MADGSQSRAADRLIDLEYKAIDCLSEFDLLDSGSDCWPDTYDCGDHIERLIELFHASLKTTKENDHE